MRLLNALILSLFCLFPALAQERGEASWRAIVKPLEADTFEVVFEAGITPLWHMYDLGPYDVQGLATAFYFADNQAVELLGEVYEIGEARHKYDSIFGFELGYFSGIARFGQKVRATSPGAVLSGEIAYKVCNDTGRCDGGSWDFRVQITQGQVVSATSAPEKTLPGRSLWSTILEAVLWGFAALLTPCVFPMIPMTVSFFMKDGRAKALIFWLLIVSLYTLPIAVIILIARFSGGEAVTADIFNWLSTHWFPNVLFFVVFMLFAASLLGAFELRMPSALVNRSDRGVERGGLVGVFFLALTLVLVSFSCTGPIVGTVLIKSTQGEFWSPIVTMFAFSAAFAAPFALFAFFPRVMERLPRSGGWLNSVKVTLGLVEIALGLKFLSVADQTYHWGILDRPVYLSIWIVVFAILGLYLLGVVRFKYDSKVEYISVGRLFLAIGVFSFVVWLIPGLWGAPLRTISGYLPPMSTQEFVSGGMTQKADSRGVKYSDVLHLPHGMSGFFDFDQAMDVAREAQKPLFVDFTGHGCVNCREMEQRVWVDPRVQKIFREHYIVVALYSDDRTGLPEAEWFTTPSGKVLKTIGRKNSYLINSRYGISSQPAYLVLDAQGDLLVPVYGYSLDTEQFISFLMSGVSAYEKS